MLLLTKLYNFVHNINQFSKKPNNFLEKSDGIDVDEASLIYIYHPVNMLVYATKMENASGGNYNKFNENLFCEFLKNNYDVNITGITSETAQLILVPKNEKYSIVKIPINLIEEFETLKEVYSKDIVNQLIKESKNNAILIYKKDIEKNIVKIEFLKNVNRAQLEQREVLQKNLEIKRKLELL